MLDVVRRLLLSRVSLAVAVSAWIAALTLALVQRLQGADHKFEPHTTSCCTVWS